MGIPSYRINHCLISADEDKNLLRGAETCDGRTLAGKRRSQSHRKAADVMLKLLRFAQAFGSSAQCVLFDSWFSSSKSIPEIRNELQPDTTAMIKKSAGASLITH